MAVTNDAIIQMGADGKKSVLDGSSNEVFKSVSASISSLFSGNRAVLEEYFKIRSFNVNGSKWSLSLSPKDATISGTLKDIEISGTADEKAVLDSMKIVQSDSNTTSYKLSNQSYRQELTTNEKSLLSK